MNIIDQMWQHLAALQTEADELGYGPEWRTMCEEQTPEAAEKAAELAWATGDAVASKAAHAAWASARAWFEAAQWAENSIETIEKAKGKQ